jgi:hypothetical protein
MSNINSGYGQSQRHGFMIENNIRDKVNLHSRKNDTKRCYTSIAQAYKDVKNNLWRCERREIDDGVFKQSIVHCKTLTNPIFETPLWCYVPFDPCQSFLSSTLIKCWLSIPNTDTSMTVFSQAVNMFVASHAPICKTKQCHMLKKSRNEFRDSLMKIDIQDDVICYNLLDGEAKESRCFIQQVPVKSLTRGSVAKAEIILKCIWSKTGYYGVQICAKTILFYHPTNDRQQDEQWKQKSVHQILERFEKLKKSEKEDEMKKKKKMKK